MTREFPKNPEPKIELPTVGRIVHIFDKVGRSPDTLRPVPVGKPMAAIVADVLAPGSLTINVGVWNPDGTHGNLTDVPHISEGYEYNHRGAQYVWDWMDYQKGQARKAEQLEQELKQRAGMHREFGGSKGGGMTMAQHLAEHEQTPLDALTDKGRGGGN